MNEKNETQMVNNNEAMMEVLDYLRDILRRRKV